MTDKKKGMTKRLGNFFKKSSIDFMDLFGLGGLGMVFYGFYQWKPFLAYIIVGGVVFILSILLGLEKETKD